MSNALHTRWSPPHRSAVSLLALLALLLVGLWSYVQGQRPEPVSTLVWGPGLEDRAVLSSGLPVRGRLERRWWVLQATADDRLRLRQLGAWLTWPIPQSAARMPGCSGDLPRMEALRRDAEGL